MTDTESAEPLEATLSAIQNNDEQGIRRALRAFVNARVWVRLDQPWDGKSLPRTDTRLLLVTDGADQAQPMLAVFTSEKHGNLYKAEDLGAFRYIAEADSAWVCLGVPDNAGIMINPNSAPSFRISPAVARVLRETAEKDVELKVAGPPSASNPK